MASTGRSVRALRVLSLVVLGSAAPVLGAGFSIFEQGTKAMGMAGAFTAQADDPSAMFHNVGGLAFFDEQKFSLGFTYITQSEADFEGTTPFPGPEARAEMETLSEAPPHFYWVKPINRRWNFGLGVNAPFGLGNEWSDQDNFAGRFISTKATLTELDINPNLGLRLSDRFGIGFGVIVRVSEIELNRRAPAIDPFSGLPVDVAQVVLESDFDTGFGWQVGFLHKLNNSFSWGFSYRSAMEIDYAGDGRLTQILTDNPQLDAIIGASLPFGQALPIETSIEFPDTASLGFALAVTRSLLVEVDVNWIGWSSFEVVVIDFTADDLPDQTLPQDWDDSQHYRLGLRWTTGPRSEWRFGYVYDESPQPDSGVGPLLPDADRNGLTVGYGRTGARLGWDLALMYLPFDERTTRVNRDGFNGTYNTTAWLLGFTLNW